MSEKLIRALQRGGRLAPKGSAWGVWRGRDLRGRCVGELSEALVASLRERGDVTRDDALRLTFKWSGPPAGVRTVGANLRPDAARRKTPRPRSPLEVALAALAGAREQAVARAAAQRFGADVERAATAQRITQNWDPSLHVDGVRGGSGDGQLYTSFRASRRLWQVRDEIGERRFGVLMELLVQGRSMAAMCRLHDWPKNQAASHLAGALTALCKAYNLAVEPTR